MPVRLMADSDWAAVQSIYAHGIATGNATFEAHVPQKSAFFSSRIPALCLVAEDPEGAVVGWAAASSTSSRPAYSGVVEHSVYVDPTQQAVGLPPSCSRS